VGPRDGLTMVARRKILVPARYRMEVTIQLTLVISPGVCKL